MNCYLNYVIREQAKRPDRLAPKGEVGWVIIDFFITRVKETPTVGETAPEEKINLTDTTG
ncbi:MAG: hypothetical protein QNJ63_02965 [Calothrix sp. MO_192.B10]|nr:hypothetical protein [Calothrix sp. MO_192.B10]